MTLLSPLSKSSISQCHNCKGARFDDARSGGHETRLASGRMGLHIELDRRNKSIVDYGWTLDDSLPHLPNLRKTAESGCAFCQFLINLFRSQDVTCLFKDALEGSEASNEVALRLFCSYTWGNTDFGLIDKHGYGSASSGLRSFQLRGILHNVKSKMTASSDYGSYCTINCLAELSPNGKELTHASPGFSS